MPSYLVLGNYTEQGITAMKESPQRLEGVKELCRVSGGRLIFFYLTMGQYDFAALTELPDDETAARVLLQIGARGAVRTTTLKAFTEEEYRRIVASLP